MKASLLPKHAKEFVVETTFARGSQLVYISYRAGFLALVPHCSWGRNVSGM